MAKIEIGNDQFLIEGREFRRLLAVDFEARRLRELVQTLINNNPNDIAADGGITVLDVWREQAKRTFEIFADDAALATAKQDES